VRQRTRIWWLSQQSPLNLKNQFPLDLTKITKKLAEKFTGISKDAVSRFEDKEVEEGSMGRKLSVWKQRKGWSAYWRDDFYSKDYQRLKRLRWNQELVGVKSSAPDLVSSEEEFMTKSKRNSSVIYTAIKSIHWTRNWRKNYVKSKNRSSWNFLKEWLIEEISKVTCGRRREGNFPSFNAKTIDMWSLISNNLALRIRIQQKHEEVLRRPNKW